MQCTGGSSTPDLGAKYFYTHNKAVNKPIVWVSVIIKQHKVLSTALHHPQNTTVSHKVFILSWPTHSKHCSRTNMDQFSWVALQAIALSPLKQMSSVR